MAMTFSFALRYLTRPETPVGSKHHRHSNEYIPCVFIGHSDTNAETNGMAHGEGLDKDQVEEVNQH